MMFLFKKQIWLVIGILLVLSACGGGGGNDNGSTVSADCILDTATLDNCKIK